MTVIEIKVEEALWSNSMPPEGIATKWLVVDGGPATEGHGVAEVRIKIRHACRSELDLWAACSLD